MKKFICASLITMAALQTNAQQSFSCPGIDRTTCLSYDDKVVNQRTACFDQDACDYRGFTCKSKLKEAVNDHDELVDKYNELLRRNKQLIEDYNRLLSERKQ